MAATVVSTVCSKDCPDVCGMLTHVEGGRVVKVEGAPDHPITQGFLCGRYQHYEEVVHHPNRLLVPLVRERKTDPFESVSWDDAVDLVARRFTEIVERHGGGAILPYHYLGHMGIVSSRYADRLWNRMNTSRVGAEICAMAGVEAVLRIFGRIRGTEAHHLDKTRLYVAWGKNPKETNVHGWLLAKHIRPRVVIDPFRSDTAETADLFIQPSPGTDSLLAIGVARILIENDWVDHRFIEERTTGFDEVRKAVLAVGLDEVERGTGVPRARMLELARLLNEHRPSLIHIGVGLQRNRNGGEMIANICMLGVLTGQVGNQGGGVLYANYDWALNDISYSHLRTDAARMHNMVKLGRDLTETDDLKALFVYNQNPAATAPNQNLVRAGLGREDLFVVVHDLFLTDTAQLANVVLPACTFAECDDLHLSYWHDYVQINNQAIPPVGESRSNYRLFRDLAECMGYDEECFRQSEDEVIREALAGTGLDADELRLGPVLWGDRDRTSFDDGHFPTPSGKIELLLPQHSPSDDAIHRYRLITPKTRHLHGSQVFNLPRKWPTVKTPWVFINPADAAREGVVEGDRVRVWNERGSVELVAKVSDRSQPGLLVTYMVRWGANANATTPDDEADMAGNSTFHTNFVTVERVGDVAPVPDGAEAVARAAVTV